MTAKEFVESAGLSVICIPDPEKTVSSAYVGDLLSWVMGRAEPDNVWITIMSNKNIVAVASLVGVGCILLCEGVTLDDEVCALASEKYVNVFSTELSAYDAAIKISGILR